MSIFVKKHYDGLSQTILLVLIEMTLWLKITKSILARLELKMRSVPGKPFKDFLCIDKDKLKRQQQIIIVGSDEEYSKVERLLVKHD